MAKNFRATVLRYLDRGAKWSGRSISRASGIPHSTLNERLTGKSFFTRDEVKKLSSLFELSEEESLRFFRLWMDEREEKAQSTLAKAATVCLGMAKINRRRVLSGLGVGTASLLVPLAKADTATINDRLITISNSYPFTTALQNYVRSLNVYDSLRRALDNRVRPGNALALREKHCLAAVACYISANAATHLGLQGTVETLITTGMNHARASKAQWIQMSLIHSKANAQYLRGELAAAISLAQGADKLHPEIGPSKVLIQAMRGRAEAELGRFVDSDKSFSLAKDGWDSVVPGLPYGRLFSFSEERLQAFESTAMLYEGEFHSAHQNITGFFHKHNEEKNPTSSSLSISASLAALTACKLNELEESSSYTSKAIEWATVKKGKSVTPSLMLTLKSLKQIVSHLRATRPDTGLNAEIVGKIDAYMNGLPTWHHG